MSSVQNLRWLMIIEDYTTQYIGNNTNPIGESPINQPVEWNDRGIFLTLPKCRCLFNSLKPSSQVSRSQLATWKVDLKWCCWWTNACLGAIRERLPCGWGYEHCHFGGFSKMIWG